MAAPAPFQQHVTFINCSDLAASEHFYGNVLALPLAYQSPGFASFYQVSPGSFLACCLRESRPENDCAGAMPGFICRDVAEVDNWGCRLQEAGVEVTKPPGPGRSSDGKTISSIYNLLAKDPAGYTVEFQAFLDPAWPTALSSSSPAAVAVPADEKCHMPTTWDEWCVLVVDVQRDFYNEPVRAAFPDLPEKVSGLLEAARVAGVEVVHLREGSCSKRSPWYQFWLKMNPGKDSSADPAAPCAFAAELPGERVFTKYGYDGTGDYSGLTQYLLSAGKRAVLVCGLVTTCCVHLNASGLFLRGFHSYVVGDCCGDRTMPLHVASLRRENRRSYCVVDTAAVRVLLANGPSFNLVTRAAANVTQFEK